MAVGHDVLKKKRSAIIYEIYKISRAEGEQENNPVDKSIWGVVLIKKSDTDNVSVGRGGMSSALKTR